MAITLEIESAPESGSWVNRTGILLLRTLRLSSQGYADAGTLDATLRDAAGTATILPEAGIRVTDGATVVFRGKIKKRGKTDWNVKDRKKVLSITAQDATCLLIDDIVDTGGLRSTAETDKARITWLLSTFGTKGVTTGATVQVVNATMPEQDFTGLSLFEAIAEVAKLSGASYYVDTALVLHYFVTEINAAPFQLSDTPNYSTTYPYASFEAPDDSIDLVNAVFVIGADEVGEWVTDASSISTYGRKEAAFRDGTLLDTASRQAAGNAILTKYKLPRGPMRMRVMRAGLRAGMTIQITNATWGISAVTYRIAQVDASILGSTQGFVYDVSLQDAPVTLQNYLHEQFTTINRDAKRGSTEAMLLAQTIQPIDVVAVLPTLPDSSYPVGSIVFLTSDGKLYKTETGLVGSWVPVVDAADMTGQITETQIANDAVTTPKILARQVTAAKIATGTITANELDVNSVIAGKIAAGAVNAQAIAAGAVTADKLLVGGGTGPVITNPGFETGDFTGWSEYDPLSIGGTYVEVVQLSGAAFGTGRYQAVIRKDAAGYGLHLISETNLPIHPGEYVMLSAILGGTNAAALNIDWLDGVGVYAGGSSIPVTPAGARLSTIHGPAPAGAFHARVSISNLYAGGTYPAYLAVDDVRVAVGDAEVTSAAGNVRIDSSGIAIFGGKLSVIDATGRTTISGGAIAANSVKVGDMMADVASNLLDNPSFEYGTPSVYGDVLGWVPIGNGGYINPSPGAGAKQGTRCHTSQGDGANYHGIYSADIPVKPGATYRMSAWVMATAGTPSFTVQIRSTDSAHANETIRANALTGLPAASWTHYSATYTVPLTGVSYLSVWAFHDPGSANNEFVDMDMVELVEISDHVRNPVGEVVIDSAGISVTNGAITVTNPGSTVIIDGTSNMFKIMQTGTMTRTWPSSHNTLVDTNVVVSGGGNTPRPCVWVMGIDASSSAARYAGYAAVTYATTGDPLAIVYCDVEPGATVQQVHLYVQAVPVTLGTGYQAYCRYYVLIEAGI